jgi:UDP-N-acetylglucosamine 2-epimerase (non-hydrolysing)
MDVLKLMFVVASRPNFMKIAPLVQEAKKQKVKFSILYTEQHKSEQMSEVFFKELNIPKPNISLGLQEIIKNETKKKKILGFLKLIPKTRKVIKKLNPDCVVVVGDVFSSVYIAVITKTLGIPVAHVEAGLRSFNNKMPEEKARIIIDKISKYLFTSEKIANINLLKEGKPKSKIFFVGNIMIDSLINKIKESENLNYYKKLKLKNKEYAIITFHRHENIEYQENLKKILLIIKEVTKKIKLILPLHPNTKKQLVKYNLYNDLQKIKNLLIIDPLSYMGMLSLMKNSSFIMTDSGGLQEESTVLKIPCLTLRTETERPITVEIGTNTIVGLDKKLIIENIEKILKGSYKNGKIPELWDGNTAERIISILKNKILS